MASPEQVKKLRSAWEQVDPRAKNQLNLDQFRRLLDILEPGRDQAAIFVDVITRSYISLVAIFFFAYLLAHTIAYEPVRGMALTPRSADVWPGHINV